MFQKAVKLESKLRLAIMGPSGAGKTYTALSIATNLGGRVALVDTEHGSASKYADLFDFDVLELAAPYHPDRFVEAIHDAAQAGYATIILDSLTHAWNGTGGMLDIVDEIAKRKTQGNTFAAWKDATPVQNRLIEGIVGAPIHVIAAMRSKQDYTQEKDERGKTIIRKVGMAAQQREGFEYEFDVVFDLDIDHNGIVTKSRAPSLSDKVFPKPGKQVAQLLTEWLHGAPAPVSRVIEATGEIVQVAQLASKETLKAMHAAGKQLYGGADAWRSAGPNYIRGTVEVEPADLTEEQALEVLAALNVAIAEAAEEVLPELAH